MTSTQEPTGETLALAIDGMSCGHCKARVEKALGALPGVQGIVVDVAAAAARVTYQPGQSTQTEIAAAVTAAGYPARVVEG